MAALGVGVARLLSIAENRVGWGGPDSNELLESATSLAKIGAWQCDLVDEQLTWTGGVFDLFGLCPQHRPDRHETLGFYSEPSRVAMERLRARAIAERGRFAMDAEIVRQDGERRWMRLTAQTVVRAGRTVALYGVKQDVTAERVEWIELRRLAEQDALTGLASRALFQSTFLDGAVLPGQALALFDMDGFKQVNDRFGHAAGDACLEEVGRRLRTAFPDATMIARIGGDEFAVVAARGTTLAALADRAKALVRRIADPIPWQGDLLMVGVSAGIACFDGAVACEPRRLFARADAALYVAKNAGRGRVRIADPA